MSDHSNDAELCVSGSAVELRGREFVTKEAFVVLTSMSASTIERLRRKGRIESLQPGGKGTRVLYPLDQLDRLRRTATASQPPSSEAGIASSDAVASKPRSGPKPKWKRNQTP
jgi:hypothetical protein